MEYTRIKGMADVYGREMACFREFEQISRNILEQFGYGEMRTPLLEKTEVFERGIGEATDIVQKEMYTLRDRKGRSLTIRPEGTASIVRAVVENNLLTSEAVLKYYYLGPMYRYERPQKGRMRQFNQLGAECFGASSPAVDAEMIFLLSVLLDRLGIDRYTIKINSIGCKDCRPRYHEALSGYYRRIKDDLCSNCQERLTANILRLLDCKEERCSILKKDAPEMIAMLCGGCTDHFSQLKIYLSELGVNFQVDPRLVRGLDYYIRTVFEFVSSELGAQDAILGGGRYDDLVEQFGGPKTPAIGFAMGVERLLLLLQEKKTVRVKGPEYYGVALDEESAKVLFTIINAMRKKGCYAEFDHRPGSMKSKMRRADRSGADLVLIFGENERINKTIVVKDMKTGNQRTISLDELFAEITVAPLSSQILHPLG